MASGTIVRAAFEEAIRSNVVVEAILERARQLGLPKWYLGAGCLAQTVWNRAHDYYPTDHIKDYDIVYFDPADVTAEGQEYYAQKARMLFGDLPAEVDVCNEARVHLWYEQEMGRAIQPYASAEAAIDTWPTTASAVGVRQEGGRLRVYAPYGLDDLMSLVVRPNKRLVSREVYEEKSARWQAHWPRLTVISWDDVAAGEATSRSSYSGQAAVRAG